MPTESSTDNENKAPGLDGVMLGALRQGIIGTGRSFVNTATSQNSVINNVALRGYDYLTGGRNAAQNSPVAVLTAKVNKSNIYLERIDKTTESSYSLQRLMGLRSTTILDDIKNSAKRDADLADENNELLKVQNALQRERQRKDDRRNAEEKQRDALNRQVKDSRYPRGGGSAGTGDEQGESGISGNIFGLVGDLAHEGVGLAAEGLGLGALTKILRGRKVKAAAEAAEAANAARKGKSSLSILDRAIKAFKGKSFAKIFASKAARAEAVEAAEGLVPLAAEGVTGAAILPELIFGGLLAGGVYSLWKSLSESSTSPADMSNIDGVPGLSRSASSGFATTSIPMMTPGHEAEMPSTSDQGLGPTYTEVWARVQRALAGKNGASVSTGPTSNSGYFGLPVRKIDEGSLKLDGRSVRLALSAAGETAGGDYGKVNRDPGTNDWDFGKYQFTAQKGAKFEDTSVGQFLIRTKMIKYFTSRDPNSSKFQSEWKAAAKNKDFRDAQDAYVDSAYYKDHESKYTKALGFTPGNLLASAILESNVQGGIGTTDKIIKELGTSMKGQDDMSAARTFILKKMEMMNQGKIYKNLDRRKAMNRAQNDINLLGIEASKLGLPSPSFDSLLNDAAQGSRKSDKQQPIIIPVNTGGGGQSAPSNTTIVNNYNSKPHNPLDDTVQRMSENYAW